MINLHLLCGIPASGKSTWAMKDATARLYETCIIISRDSIRKSLIGEGNYFSKEKEVFNKFIDSINSAISEEIEHIYIDATHVSPQSRNKVLSKLKTDGKDIALFVEIFEVDKEIAITRNQKREGFARVPDEAIIKMSENWVTPRALDKEFDNFVYVLTRRH